MLLESGRYKGIHYLRTERVILKQRWKFHLEIVGSLNIPSVFTYTMDCFHFEIVFWRLVDKERFRLRKSRQFHRSLPKRDTYA